MLSEIRAQKNGTRSDFLRVPLWASEAYCPPPALKFFVSFTCPPPATEAALAAHQAGSTRLVSCKAPCHRVEYVTASTREERRGYRNWSGTAC